MAEAVKITEQEIHEVLAGLSPDKPTPDNALSTREIADACGCGETTVRKALGALARAGRLVVYQRRSFSIAGRPCNTPVYAIRETEG